jgi:hypothetical protein
LRVTRAAFYARAFSIFDKASKKAHRSCIKGPALCLAAAVSSHNLSWQPQPFAFILRAFSFVAAIIYTEQPARRIIRLQVWSKMKLSYKLVIAFISAALLTACGGNSSAPPTLSVGGSNGQAAGTITVKPSELSLLVGGSAKVVVAEKGYNGTFTSAGDGCKNVATWTPSSGTGPKLKVRVKGVAVGSCTITFSDAQNHTAQVGVTVTTTSGSQTFRDTDKPQHFKVPAGVTQVTIVAGGGGGGGSPPSSCDLGGNPPCDGSLVTATIPVTPGESLGVFVGGGGGAHFGAGQCYNGCKDGGYNGGGLSGGYGGGFQSGGGGGASDVRQGGSGLSNRVVVAGGGGGCGHENCYNSANPSDAYGGDGGLGGGLVGGAGGVGASDLCGNPVGGFGGAGGTQSEGGPGGASQYGSFGGAAGGLGVGGNADRSQGDGLAGGGGGGGGYYGGGAGASTGYVQSPPSCYYGGGGGGGGGSSYVEPSATGVSIMQGGWSQYGGGGQIVISWGQGAPSSQRKQTRHLTPRTITSAANPRTP